MRIGYLAAAARRYAKYKSTVAFETTLVIGTRTFYGGQPSYGYRASTEQYPMGSMSNNQFNNQYEVLMANWHVYDRTGGFVIKGDHRNLSFTKCVINGLVVPVTGVSYNAGANTTSVTFDWSSVALPGSTGPGRPVTIQLVTSTPRDLPVQVYEAEIIVGKRTDVYAPNPSYGFRDNSLPNPMGALSDVNLEGLPIYAMNWHDALNEFRIGITGNARVAGKQWLVMVGGVLLTFKYSRYAPTADQTTLVFDTLGMDISKVEGAKLPAVIFTATGKTSVPAYRHECQITVGTRTLTGLVLLGYRDPSNNGMGSIANPLYKGTNAIFFAQWNTTDKQFNLYITGDVRADNITEAQIDGIMLTKRIVHDYVAGSNYTRLTFDTTGLYQPLTVSEVVDLRF